MLATPELIREAAAPQRLAAALPRWLGEVPLYRPFAAASQRDVAEPHGLEASRQLPLITKRDIRHNFPRNFLRDEVDLDELLERNLVELEHTSGTSEPRTALLLGRGWWAEQEARALRLNGLVARVLDQFPDARRVTLTSPVCNGDICYAGVPARSERAVGNALFVNLSRHPFLWTDGDLARMAAETVDWQPQFLDVDPVYGALFARYCERAGVRLPSLKFILCSYEFVSGLHRRILERAFGVPVFNLYGSTETGHLLMETERGELAPSFDTAFLEMIGTDPLGVGDLVVSTLTNEFMPLLRYRIGDLVERREQPYRTTFQVHGRVADAFTTPSGARVTTRQIDGAFADLEGILHYQLRQSPDGACRLQFVPDGAGPGAGPLGRLQRRLQAMLELPSGPALQEVDLLLAESSGKFRLGHPAG